MEKILEFPFASIVWPLPSIVIDFDIDIEEE